MIDGRGTRCRARSSRVAAQLGLLTAVVACGGGSDVRSVSRDSVSMRAPAHADSARAATVERASTADSGTTPGTVTFFNGDHLRSLADRLGQDGTTGRTIARNEAYRLVVSRRNASGSPEVHEHWMDVTLVQAGRATLLAGGRLEGGRREADGEWRGGSIAAGTRYPVATGDLFVVPAGVPHQFLLTRGDTIRYLTVKVPRRQQP
jgi:mannose-6-phosphate isomerase-like protein (cupin superfamily)